MQKIIIIAGPTGVGKTALSIEVAKKFNGEIVGADSIQIYKNLDIGSAKVTEEEKEGVVHHLVDFVSPKNEYSAGEYVKDAKKAIDEITIRNHTPIIVGGTGMYISSLLFEPGVTCGKDDEYRKELETILKEKGSEYLHSMLEKVDPESANLIHKNHQTRIIRALEIFHVSGKKKSEQKSSLIPRYDYLLIGLTADRKVLYERINKRVDKMIDSGLIEEVQSLMSQGITSENQCMNGIGYKETYDFLTGKFGKTEFVEKLKQVSRNYAKRQITFFKKVPNIVWKTYDQKDEIFELIENFLKK